MTKTTKELAMEIIDAAAGCSPWGDRREMNKTYVIGFLAGHLATILAADPILRREFSEKAEKVKLKKVKGPAARA